MGNDAQSDTLPTLEEFLAEAEQFRLGDLPTEQPHPKTTDLSELARSDVGRALAVLLAVDRDAIAVMRDYAEALRDLARAVDETLEAGGRVFLCGCGATGRLALSLEAFWRTQMAGTKQVDSVVALMAGGDVALIRSIEGFEDDGDYGARHLKELGLGPGDLLIGCTEGGETPYVIGATEHAAQVSSRPPWFLYCNPDHALQTIERSRRVIDDERIQKISFAIGPMALSGSTRLQATTVLMMAAGLALLGGPGDDFETGLTRLLDRLERLDPDVVRPFVEAESAVYEAGEAVIYEADRHAITVLTDTTERAPTFNLSPFENQREDGPEPSLCYLMIPRARDATEAWNLLLRREPRPLEWPGLAHLTGRERLVGFDFSRRILAHRARLLPHTPHHRFGVSRRDRRLVLRFDELERSVDLGGLSLLEEHVVLKLLLNMHSTLVMGRLGRYQSNVMTWVRPSNRKLIDRAIRYVDHLLRASGGPSLSYEELARHCFLELALLGDNESIVLRTVERVRGGSRR